MPPPPAWPRLRAGALQRQRTSTGNLPPNVPEWSKTLGAPILASPYGVPSRYVANVKRRESPGLTRTPHSSVVVHAAAEPLRHHHAVGPAFRAASRRRAGHRSQPASPHDPRARAQSAHLHDGRPDAIPVGVAHPFHRVRREHRHGMGQRRGADGAVHARHACRAANGPACRCRRCSTRSGIDHKNGEIRAGRRRGRRRRCRARSRWRWRWTTSWSATARTARCCVRSRAFRCGCSCRACRACRASSGCAGSRWATSRGTRARRRCTTST